MDNISHSLAGLALAELVDRSLAPEPDPGRARTRHRLLLVSCWVASNFPDLDLVLTPLAPQPLGYLLQHRGHTHTLAGLLPQALLLLALLWLWPAARALLRESAATLRATVGLVAAGLALHLGMDYLNVYGVHPFFPFDTHWLYGDMVFIVEPVFWIVLGAPLAVLARPGMARRAALAMLVALPVLFTALGFLQWGSLAGLALAGMTLAWLQWRSRARGRGALGLGLALAALFVASQGLAVRSARALVATQPRQGELVDAAMSAFPANPVCWSFVAVELDRQAGQLRLRRGLISLAPELVPPQSCPARIAGPAPAAGTPAGPASLAWQWAQSMPLARLRALQQRDCRVDAWLRFARAPSLQDDLATDARFGPPGGVNFSTLSVAPGASAGGCTFAVPGWGYPRGDVLGLDAHTGH